MLKSLFVAFAVGLPASASRHSNGLRGLHLSASAVGPYGNPKCPCVGLDNVKGEMTMTTGKTKTMYPAETGASCTAWDSDRAPGCEVGNDKNYTQDGEPSWCTQSWCYVDPCKCDIPVIPKVSGYLPDGTYQGKPIYYSYHTCGGVDSWTEKHHKEACVNQKTAEDCTNLEKCSWDGKSCAGKALGVCNAPLDAKIHGAENCRCIGLDNVEGSLDATLGDGRKVTFPATFGASCQPHEEKTHPDCLGDKPPKWCKDSWCYVDPCSCGQVEPPRVNSGWLGKDVTFQGKNVYYSYTTCGSEDAFTAVANPTACVNLKTASACNEKAHKCAWVVQENKCLGKEIAQSCHGHIGGNSSTPSELPWAFLF